MPLPALAPLRQGLCYGIDVAHMGTVVTDMAAAKRTGAPPPPSPLRGALAQNLRAARLKAGLTQKQLSELASVSREYIGDIENGVANVSIDVLSVLAGHVGHSPIDLLNPPTQKRPRR
jgi:DNA-binding XRE family transcriptional regulator